MTCNGNLSHPPTYIVGEDWKKTVYYHCLMLIELIQFERLTVGLRGVKVWRRTAKNLTYEDRNFGTHSRMWKMREIKIYPIQIKIAREISGGYSLYHLMIFTPWSSVCGVICTGGVLLRVQVGGAKPRSACPCRQHPPLSRLWQHPLHLPPCGRGKKTKYFSYPFGNNEIKKGLKITKSMYI